MDKRHKWPLEILHSKHFWKVQKLHQKHDFATYERIEKQKLSWKSVLALSILINDHSTSFSKKISLIVIKVILIKSSHSMTTLIKVYKATHLQIREIRRIQDPLPSSLILLINALISRLVYCNSVYNGIAKSNVQLLHRIQNITARVITKTLKHNHIKPVLKIYTGCLSNKELLSNYWSEKQNRLDNLGT